ncbi:MAG TPA: type I-E CRISPR-associated protein Cas6/Cse3/CasE [Candidatus Dormibacteraeota bacterium]|nr:type I-E CRISPR-associated protein Cas6/Cse3/CasE [Candidatus Dormibacteraeota bacterium]
MSASVSSATTPVIARARLRRDRPADALARILVPEEPGARLGAAHSLVWALFADGPDRRRDFLWREMRPGEFLILANRPPVDPHNLFDLEYKPFAPMLSQGQRLGFELRANPVVSVPGPHGRRGRRADVVMHALHDVAQGERAAAREGVIREAGASWLARKGSTSGFSIEPDRLHIDGYEQVRIPREGKRGITFSTLIFQGVLTVADADRFLASVLRGFGAAKAFGCGLMLIRQAGR